VLKFKDILKIIYTYDNPKLEKYIRYCLVVIGVIVAGVEYSFSVSIITFGALYLIGRIIGWLINIFSNND